MNNEKQIGIGLHQGNVILRLAKHYADLLAVILEVVQNAIDADAKRVDVKIDLKSRQFLVADDGAGASQEMVKQALRTIGMSMKERGRYGQFGIGLVSPLSICRRFDFTSCPAPRKNGYMSYRFVTRDIAVQESVFIPTIDRPDLEFGSESTWWRTCVHADGLTKDRQLMRMDQFDLAREIALRYGVQIRKRKIEITIGMINAEGKSMPDVLVEAPEYTGEELPPYHADESDCGKVRIQLYRARMSGGARKGSIVFEASSNPSRISANQFVSCTSRFLEPVVAKAIMGGVFEGCITCEKVVLHADRKQFEESDALVGLCLVLEKWYEEVGMALIEEALEDDSFDRFQRIGQDTIPFATCLLKQPQFELVRKKIEIGSVGEGHTRVPKTKVIGTSEEPALATHGKGAGGESTAPSGGNPKKDHPQHNPGTVSGPRGKRRTEVMDSSTGVSFSYCEMEDFRVPYTYDPKTGKLTFNVCNPDWGRCSESDAFLRQYHYAVVTTALTVELTGNSENQSVVNYAWENLSIQAFAIMNGEAVSVRTPKKK